LQKYRNSSNNNKKKKLKRDGIKISEIENFEIAREIFPSDKDKIYYKDIEYLTGGWFEEYVYFKVKEREKLDDQFLGINYHIKKVYGEEIKNEFDVLYIKNGTPHIIECKTSNYDSVNNRNFLPDTIYKLSSLKNDFGLSAKAYIFTLDEDINENYIERALGNRIKIINREQILKDDFSLLFGD